MQLSVPPSETEERTAAEVEPSGFTLVEEDDVAFSLQLCREVHRIYGEYQDGRLPPTESMLAGLVVTVEMLAALSRTVVDGMPSMRITVAAAQTREMLAVAFGQDPMQKPVQRRLSERYRSLVTEAVGPGAGTPRPGGRAPAARAARAALEPGRPALDPSPPPPAPSPAAASGTFPSGAPRRSRLRRYFGRLRAQGPVPPPLPRA